MISIVYSTNQLLWRLNLCVYSMCTVRFGICVHSCEQVSGMDGEERNLSFSFSLFLFLLFFFFFFFVFLFSLSPFHERRRERVWNSLSLAYTHAYTLHCLLLSCLYTYYRQHIVLWNFRIEESNEPRRRRQRQ